MLMLAKCANTNIMVWFIYEWKKLLYEIMPQSLAFSQRWGVKGGAGGALKTSCLLWLMVKGKTQKGKLRSINKTKTCRKNRGRKNRLTLDSVSHTAEPNHRRWDRGSKTKCDFQSKTGSAIIKQEAQRHMNEVTTGDLTPETKYSKRLFLYFITC